MCRKILVNNIHELLAIFKKDEPCDIEAILEIEFGYESDGTFPSDLDYIREDEGYDLTKVKISKDSTMVPIEYPCLVVLPERVHWDDTPLPNHVTDDFYYVYESDFKHD